MLGETLSRDNFPTKATSQWSHFTSKMCLSFFFPTRLKCTNGMHMYEQAPHAQVSDAELGPPTCMKFEQLPFFYPLSWYSHVCNVQMHGPWKRFAVRSNSGRTFLRLVRGSQLFISIHNEIIAGNSRYGLQSIAESRTKTGNHTLSDRNICRSPGVAIHSCRTRSSPPYPSISPR